MARNVRGITDLDRYVKLFGESSLNLVDVLHRARREIRECFRVTTDLSKTLHRLLNLCREFDRHAGLKEGRSYAGFLMDRLLKRICTTVLDAAEWHVRLPDKNR